MNARSMIHGTIFALAASTVLAQVGTPGWEYGRANCGPVANLPITNRAACLACCQAKEDGSLNDPRWTPADTANCKAYCNAVFGTPFFPGGPAGF